MQAYFPVEWDFGVRPGDGLGGNVVDDAGTIYVYDDNEESDTFEEVLLKVTLREIVEGLIEGHGGGEDRKIVDPEIVRIIRRLQAAFSVEIERLEASVGVK